MELTLGLARELVALVGWRVGSVEGVAKVVGFVSPGPYNAGGMGGLGLYLGGPVIMAPVVVIGLVIVIGVV